MSSVERYIKYFRNMQRKTLPRITWIFEALHYVYLCMQCNAYSNEYWWNPTRLTFKNRFMAGFHISNIIFRTHQQQSNPSYITAGSSKTEIRDAKQRVKKGKTNRRLHYSRRTIVYPASLRIPPKNFSPQRQQLESEPFRRRNTATAPPLDPWQAPLSRYVYTRSRLFAPRAFSRWFASFLLPLFFYFALRLCCARCTTDE